MVKQVKNNCRLSVLSKIDHSFKSIDRMPTCNAQIVAMTTLKWYWHLVFKLLLFAVLESESRSNKAVKDRARKSASSWGIFRKFFNYLYTRLFVEVLLVGVELLALHCRYGTVYMLQDPTWLVEIPAAYEF